MVFDCRHFQTHYREIRVGRSSGTRRYSFGAHERSAWIAAHDRAPFCQHHGSSVCPNPPPNADSRPYHCASEEGVRTCAVVRTETIKKVRPVPTAARQKRLATVRENTLLEKLEEKLLNKENRCVELRQQIEAKKQEVPMRSLMAGSRALSSSHLALTQRAPAPDSDGDSLQALKAKLLRKEEECETELETLILLILDL
jgi:hypothetical protein